MTKQDQSDAAFEREHRPESERREEASLARTYREAAAGDAHHERRSGGPSPAGHDPTLVPTDEVPDVPPTDVAKPDAANGEAPGVTTGDARKDAELSGLEPGEMGRE